MLVLCAVLIMAIISISRLLVLGKLNLTKHELESWPPKKFIDWVLWSIPISFIGYIVTGMLYIGFFIKIHLFSSPILNVYLFYFLLLFFGITFISTIVWLLKSRNWKEWKTIFTIPLGLTLLLYLFAFILDKSILATNSFFGHNHQKIIFSGKIISFDDDRVNIVKVKELGTNKSYKFTVGDTYKVGDTFQKEMRVGNWNFLYALNE